MSVMQRGNQWCLRKRVPARFKPVETRAEVWISLQTDSKRAAVEKAPAVWNAQLTAWEAQLAGNSDDASAQFEAAQKLASAQGLRYLPLEEVINLPIEPLLERIESISNRTDPAKAAAVLGTAPVPTITVTQALEAYWGLAKDRTYGKSPDQLRRWENPRKKAVRNFVDVVCDKPIAEITADDMLEFRGWWQERIEIEDLTPNSANKDLIHLGDILKTVNTMKRLGLTLPLDGLAFKEGDGDPRPSFSEAWIKDKILAPGALDGLDPEARAIFVGMINTGYRPSEAACAMPDQVVLEADIPHLIIKPRADRTIKNKNSKRILPLVGVSMDAFRAFPNGFPRYRDNNAGLSENVNGFLRSNGLMESDKHVMYSLRHSFEDRLLRTGVDERVRRDLMGHGLDRPRYGDGGGLAFKAQMLERIAF